MPKPTAATATIDALEYLGGRVPSDVPTRDLGRGDLHRIAYTRKIAKAATEPQFHPETGKPINFERPTVTDDDISSVVAELVASGRFGVPKTSAPAPDHAPAPAPTPDGDQTV